MMKKIIENLKQEKEKRFYTAIGVLKRFVIILQEKYNVKKIILIGSCLNKNAFHFYSDIDICVEGLSDDLYFQALGELMIEAGEFSVDLIPKEHANKRMLEHIKRGKIIYEKG